jgi:single-strand DNA-binding protein
MSSLNKAMLIGNLGRDPEIRFTPDGSPVATFSLATGEVWTDKSGTRQERTEWHNIVAWNKLADLAKRYLTKGRQVYIEGRIRTREWDDREGNKRRTTEIIATQMVLLGSRQQGSETAAAPPQPVQRSTPEMEQGPGDAGITDDDIPF